MSYPIPVITMLSAATALLLASCSSGTKTVSIQAVPDHVEVKQLSHRANHREMETRITGLVNQERSKRGMEPLESHRGLTDLARGHSVVMAKQAEEKRVLLHINHDGFVKRRFAARDSFGMSSLGENVAANWGYRGDKMAKVVQDWMDSPKHRKNILSQWDTGGVGVHVDSKGAIYATQLFGTSDDRFAGLQTPTKVF